MNVLHLIGWPIPETVGGTEVYVEALCRALARQGVRCAVGFPDRRRPWSAGVHDGLPTCRYHPVTGEPGAQAADLRRWLDGLAPDVVHVQSITQGLSWPEIDAIADAGYPLVMTVHVPGVVCSRGTMLRDGRYPCDGEMRLERCTRCYLQGRGLPRPAGRLLTLLPAGVRAGAAAVLPSRWATALRMPDVLASRFTDTRRMFARCHRIVAVCQWLRDALRRNGVPEDRLVLSRQATELPATPPPHRPRSAAEPLHVGYLGRFDPIKGVDVLLRAVAGLPRSVRVRVSVHGRSSGSEGSRYLAGLRRLAARDGRIELADVLPRERLDDFFARIDLLAVPSTWLETGPLVVYEALAHRVPVLGSRLGGIAELVRDGLDGWLLPPGDVPAWRAQLRALAEGRVPLPRLDEPAPVLRSWEQAAAEMRLLYEDVVGLPSAAVLSP